MTDITRAYKVEVKQQRARTGIKGSNTSILSSKCNRSQFTVNARGVQQTIEQLDALIEESKVKYIGSTCSTDFTSLSDQERLDIDLSANMFIVQCKEAIESLVRIKTKDEGQLKTHHDGVTAFLESYLKRTCVKFTHTKALYVSQSLEQHKLTKLSSRKITSIRSMEEVEDYAKTASQVTFLEDEDLGLSPAEMQVLEQENEEMYREMTALGAEVQNIEGTVMEISRLQEIFTDKVLTQADQITVLHHTAVETTEHTRSGNEELREAIKNSAGFRVWLLFFFVMASCCLLFLDWYS